MPLKNDDDDDDVQEIPVHKERPNENEVDVDVVEVDDDDDDDVVIVVNDDEDFETVPTQKANEESLPHETTTTTANAVMDTQEPLSLPTPLPQQATHPPEQKSPSLQGNDNADDNNNNNNNNSENKNKKDDTAMPSNADEKNNNLALETTTDPLPENKEDSTTKHDAENMQNSTMIVTTTATTTAPAAATMQEESPKPAETAAVATKSKTSSQPVAESTTTPLSQQQETAASSRASPKNPPPTTTTTTPTPSRPALINLHQWDQTWEEQYERRKAAKVVFDPLPNWAVGRADDPTRLPAGPCLCTGPCSLQEQCPCNHSGLYCSDLCACCGSSSTTTSPPQHGGKKKSTSRHHGGCENNAAHAEARHRALVQAIQKGHRPLIDECCPCEPTCNALTCPCALLGQRCRHTAVHRVCRNPIGIEMARDFVKKQATPLAVCVRKLNRKPAQTMIPDAPPPTTPKTTTTTRKADPSSNRTTTRSPARKKAKVSSSSSSSSTIMSTKDIGITPTPVQQAWEEADQAANAFFVHSPDKKKKNQGLAVQSLQALYEVATNARVHARAELKLNENERWWWRDIIPSAASPTGKKKTGGDHGNDDDDDEVDLECHESYPTLQVERDVQKQERREAIIQVSQETIILRYAATVLREKARAWAARRVATPEK